MKLVILVLIISGVICLGIPDPERPSMGELTISGSKMCPQYICRVSSQKSGCATYSNGAVVMEECLGDW